MSEKRKAPQKASGPCPVCRGTGLDEQSEPCQACDGSGELRRQQTA
jgi:DnaJ-class molecular chaperone